MRSHAGFALMRTQYPR